MGNRYQVSDARIDQDNLCEFRSDCCGAFPLSKVSYDYSTDLGSRWMSYCSGCGELENFTCDESHSECVGGYPILVKPEADWVLI